MTTQENIKKLERLVSRSLEKKHFNTFTKQAQFLGNNTYTIAGLHSTDTRELFLMYVCQQEGIDPDKELEKIRLSIIAKAKDIVKKKGEGKLDVLFKGYFANAVGSAVLIFTDNDDGTIEANYTAAGKMYVVNIDKKEILCSEES